MNSSPIFFEFEGEQDARMALDTLQELGYQPEFISREGKPTIHVHVENQDLASAMEIAQSLGGNLTQLSGEEETRMYDEAYAMDGLAIPAHLVNEDWPESYSEAKGFNEDWPEGYSEAKGYAEPGPDRIMASYAMQMNGIPVDPERPNTLAGDEDVNGFDAGVHM